MKILRIFLVITLVTSSSLVSSACPSAPVSVVTPAGQIAYKADQLVNELGILQDAAIGANSEKILSDSSTRLIVTFVKSSVTTIAQTPNGWKTTVTTGLAQLQKDLPPADAQKYSVYFALLNTIIAGIS